MTSRSRLICASETLSVLAISRVETPQESILATSCRRLSASLYSSGSASSLSWLRGVRDIRWRLLLCTGHVRYVRLRLAPSTWPACRRQVPLQCTCLLLAAILLDFTLPFGPACQSHQEGIAPLAPASARVLASEIHFSLCGRLHVLRRRWQPLEAGVQRIELAQRFAAGGARFGQRAAERGVPVGVDRLPSGPAGERTANGPRLGATRSGARRGVFRRARDRLPWRMRQGAVICRARDGRHGLPAVCHRVAPHRLHVHRRRERDLHPLRARGAGVGSACAGNRWHDRLVALKRRQGVDLEPLFCALEVVAVQGIGSGEIAVVPSHGRAPSYCC